MNLTKNAYGLYALVFIVAWVGALLLGVPAHILILLAIASACPLMMLLMMHGGHGDGSRNAGQADPPDKHEPHHPGPAGP
ncbi:MULTISPECIES: DUF2933 domain-containing protein [Streptosporangium]|uniref:DUF2933 domain-containing protein n=1 Tax=Streptosporangium brasiliense TaxID=47480 RepID=A0ABT9RIZ2_9ACTN|nr:DUF2933 domain-containing protein [Streptosporangium brasiliense]MDP9868792.1 hypothetical protein [Streptosporangium brasiliense]